MKESPIEWTLVDDMMISFAREGAISTRSYERWIHDVRTKSFKKYLATTEGGMVDLNSVQRKGVADALKSKNVKLAVITDQALVRGIVTALGWMGVNVASFSWPETEQALSFLDVPPHAIARYMVAIKQLKGRTPTAA